MDNTNPFKRTVPVSLSKYNVVSLSLSLTGFTNEKLLKSVGNAFVSYITRLIEIHLL